MFRTLMPGSLLFAWALVACRCASAAPPQHVHLGPQGAVDRPTLVRRLDLGPGVTLVPTTTLKTLHGNTEERNEEQFHGLPVFGCSVVIERDAAGHVLRVDGRVARNLAADMQSVRPMISANDAIHALRHRLGLDAHTPVRNIQHHLVIDPRGSRPALAYQVSFFSAGGIRAQHPTALVDARDGQVIDVWRGLAMQVGGARARPAGRTASGPSRPGSTPAPAKRSEGSHD